MRKLGDSGLLVSAVGLGCWQFSKRKGPAGKFWRELPDGEIKEIVKQSIAGGVNWFDTAESYGRGESERSLARALNDLGISPGEVIVADKWMPLLRPARTISRTIDMRLENLSGFPIDLHQVHNPYYFSSTRAVMEAMAGLAKRKKVRFVGVSNFSARRMRLAHEILKEHGLKLISNQVSYSLLNRRIEINGVLDTARELGISIIAYSPLALGLLTGRFHDDPGLIRRTPGFRRYLRKFKPAGLRKSLPLITALKNIAAKHGATPAQAALSWLIHFAGDEVVAIPGASRPSQAADNAGAMTLHLDNNDLSLLDRRSRSYL